MMSRTLSQSNISLEWIVPEWPAPRGVHACTTTRLGGVSMTPFESMNLAAHVGDSQQAVLENRSRLMESLGLPAEPVWLDQAHGIGVVNVANVTGNTKDVLVADAAYTDHSGRVCAVLTADCLPLLLCDRAGTCIAAVHAGWRGLAAGLIEAAIAALNIAPKELMAWMGPAIGPHSFEVGDEVREIFLHHDSATAGAFIPSIRQRPPVPTSSEEIASSYWFANIYRLAQLRLAALGVQHVYGGKYDTFRDTRFYSYRRDGVTGRMATLIWMGAA